MLDADIRGFFDAMAHSWIIGCGCSLDDDGSCGGGGEAGLVCSADKRCGGFPGNPHGIPMVPWKYHRQEQ